MDLLQTRFFQLLSMRTKMVGPGASEIVLSLAAVAPGDGASDSDEPFEDLLFTSVGSTSDVSSDMAFSVNQRIAASTTGSQMVRVTACGMKVAVPSGQSDSVTVLAPGSSVHVDPTANLAYGSEVSVVVDEGAFLDMEQTEFVKARCEPASMPPRQEGAQHATREI